MTVWIVIVVQTRSGLYRRRDGWEWGGRPTPPQLEHQIRDPLWGDEGRAYWISVVDEGVRGGSARRDPMSVVQR
jgi:hypothetical protein